MPGNLVFDDFWVVLEEVLESTDAGEQLDEMMIVGGVVCPKDVDVHGMFSFKFMCFNLRTDSLYRNHERVPNWMCNEL